MVFLNQTFDKINEKKVQMDSGTQAKKNFMFTGAFKMEKSRKINPTFIPVAEVRAPS